MRATRDYGLVTRRELRRDHVRAVRQAGAIRNGRPLNFIVHVCPTDDFEIGARFSWEDVRAGAKAGNWPEGMVFKRPDGRLYRIRGELVEVE